MEIQINTNVPDSTYSRTGDHEPYFKNNTLYIVDGKGTHRGWGIPQTTSTIVLNDNDLTSIHIGFSHKHGGSQFWRHYKNNIQVMWKKLDDTDRLRILDAYREKAPKWANIPGKITIEYLNNPNNPFLQIERDNVGGIIAYKYLYKREDSKYCSFVSSSDGDIYIWENNSLDADRLPEDNNTNGIYAAKCKDSPILNAYNNRYHAVLLQLLLSGKIIEFKMGYRAEHADILGEIK